MADLVATIDTATRLIAIFTGATALFALAAAVIAYGGYRHTRTISGHRRKAVKIRSGLIDDDWFPADPAGDSLGAFSFYNDSDIDQPFTLDGVHVLWPIGLSINYNQGEFYFPPTGVTARGHSKSIVVKMRRKNGQPCTAKWCFVFVTTRDSIRDKGVRHLKRIRLTADNQRSWVR